MALAALVPLSMGLLSLIHGPAVLRGVSAPVTVDLDSHFRYLSGLLLGIGIAFVAAIPRVELHAGRFKLLCAIIVVGGIGRLLSLVGLGIPGPGHVFGLFMELGVVPAITLWQARIARRWPRQ